MWAMVMNDEIREILDGLFETLENDLLSRSQYKILLDYITNLQKEIDRLNNDIKTSLKENEAKEKVIKKQDYVINELEKWLKEYADKDTMSSIIFGVVLNHLIDLKGENNEKD